MIDSTTLAILERQVDPKVVQTELTKEQTIMAMVRNVLDGRAYTYRRGATVWYVVFRTRYVGDIHVLSEDRSAGIILSLREMLDDARARGLRRIEGRTHNKGFLPLARKCGMTLEGIRTQSYFTGDEFIDEYEMGIIL